jgi:hypothetical protein
MHKSLTALKEFCSLFTSNSGDFAYFCAPFAKTVISEAAPKAWPGGHRRKGFILIAFKNA